MRRLVITSCVLVMLVGLLYACAGGEDDSAPPVVFLSATPRPSATATFPPPRPTTIGTPTPTTCAGNTDWIDTYEVQPNDTLGRIALLSGTTVTALRQGNCLNNSDFVFVGQVLRVPNTFSLTLATNPDGAAGIIVFVNESAGGRSLWAVRSNGAFPRALTEDLLVWGRPVRSPNLTRVAFRAVSRFHLPEDAANAPIDLPTDLYVVNIDGSGLRQLVDQGPQDALFRSLPIWSVDGERLAFTEQRGTVGSLVVIDIDGQNRQVVLSEQLAARTGETPPAPAWSPDGTQLATVIWNANGTSRLVLTGTTGRSGIEQVLIEEFIFLDGPLWVPFNGENGQPAVAVNIFDAFRGEAWHVVNPASNALERRNGGLRLTDDTLRWWLAMADVGPVLYENGAFSTELQVLSTFSSISFAPAQSGLVAATTDGLQFIGLEEPVRTTIFNGQVDAPVWSEPVWLVLP